MTNPSLIDALLVDANLLIYRQSLSKMDKIAVQLDEIRKEYEPINPVHMLLHAADYTSLVALGSIGNDLQQMADYLMATGRIVKAVKELDPNIADVFDMFDVEMSRYLEGKQAN